MELKINELASSKTPPWKVRTDIANIYSAFIRAQKNEDINHFVASAKADLETHKYTFFPMRVTGNHWGLLIVENNKLGTSLGYEDYNAYYTSSSTNLIDEKVQVQPLVNALFNTTEDYISTINPGAIQNDGYNCGVYLVFYITHLLKKDKISYSSLADVTVFDWEIIKFRKHWSKRVSNWCVFDSFSEENVIGDNWASLGISEEWSKQWFNENAPVGKKGFTFLDTKKLIEIGFRPNDFYFAKWSEEKISSSSSSSSYVDIDIFVFAVDGELDLLRREYKLNRTQYLEIANKKMKGELPLETWETKDGVEKWKKQLEQELALAI